MSKSDDPSSPLNMPWLTGCMEEKHDRCATRATRATSD